MYILEAYNQCPLMFDSIRRECFNIYVWAAGKAYMIETSLYSPVNLTTTAVYISVSVFIALHGYSLFNVG